MLPAGELDELRATQLEALPDVATLARPASRNYDGRGGIVPTAPATVAAAVPARLARPTASELTLTAEQFGRSASWVATLPHGTGALAGDHLTIDRDGTPVELLVIGHLSEPSSWATAERLACVEAP